MLGLLAAVARAENPLVLPEVTVEASPMDTYLPAQTNVGRDELIDAHKSELTDALQLTPGMNVRQGGQGEARLDMRGFDQRAVLFTLDGVPVYDPYNGVVNLDLFPLEMLGNVEIDRGPSSSIYGPNGMAGTVKMTTFTPSTPLAAAASTIWRNSDFWDARASAAAAQDRFSALLGGRFLTSPGFPLSGEFDDRPPTRRRLENGGLRLNSDQDEKSGFGDFTYKLSDEGSVHAAALGSVAEFGIPPSTTNFLPPFLRTDHEEFDHLHAGIDQILTPSVGASAAVFYSAYSIRQSQFSGPDFTTKILTTTADSDELGGIGRVTVHVADRDELTIAGQLRRSGADIVATATGPPSRPAFTTSSVAFENVLFVTERIRLLVGLSDDMQNNGGGGTDWELDPQAGVSVDLGHVGVVRAAVSRKVNFPTLRELFDPQQGNPTLKPEKALNYEIGYRVDAEHFYVATNLFRSEVDDLIQMEDSGDGGGPAANFEKAVLQGVELAAGATPLERLRIDVNYTYLDASARETINGVSKGSAEIQHKPPHRFNGVVQILLPAAFRLRLEGLYTAAQVDQFGTNITADSYALFNLQVARTLGKHLDVFAGVDNVLDVDYEDKLGSPEPGRWVFAGVRATY